MNLTQRLSLWYQKGYVQKALTMAAYLALVLIFSLILERLALRQLFDWLDNVLPKYLLDQQGLLVVKRDILEQSSGFGITLIALALANVIALFLILKASTYFNIVAPVTLDKAVRYIDAMERLGLLQEREQRQFIGSFRIPLYVAEAPLTMAEEEGIRARLYVFAHNPLSSKRFLDEHKGQRRLCFKLDDLNAALDKVKATLGVRLSPEDEDSVDALKKRLAEAEKNRVALENEKKALNNRTLDLVSQNKQLSKENEDLKDLKQGQVMRSAKKDRAEQELFLYSITLSPIYQRLVEGKHDPRDLTRSALNDLFATLIKKQPTTQETFFLITQTRPTRLPENICDAIWNTLKAFDLVNTGGAAPAGNQGRLMEIVFGK